MLVTFKDGQKVLAKTYADMQPTTLPCGDHNSPQSLISGTHARVHLCSRLGLGLFVVYGVTRVLNLAQGRVRDDWVAC